MYKITLHYFTNSIEITGFETMEDTRSFQNRMAVELNQTSRFCDSKIAKISHQDNDLGFVLHSILNALKIPCLPLANNQFETLIIAAISHPDNKTLFEIATDNSSYTNLIINAALKMIETGEFNQEHFKKYLTFKQEFQPSQRIVYEVIDKACTLLPLIKQLSLENSQLKQEISRFNTNILFFKENNLLTHGEAAKPAEPDDSGRQKRANSF